MYYIALCGELALEGTMDLWKAGNRMNGRMSGLAVLLSWGGPSDDRTVIFFVRPTSRSVSRSFPPPANAFWRVGKTAKSDYWLRHVCPSSRPPARNNSAPSKRVLMNLVTVICRENSNSIKI